MHTFTAARPAFQSTSPATEAALVAQMQQNGPVLNGWDVVFHLLEDPINRIFGMQFAATSTQILKEILFEYCQVAPNPNGPGQLAIYTGIDLTLMQPLLRLDGGGVNTATVTFQVAGAITTSTGEVDDAFDCGVHPHPDSSGKNWITKKTPVSQTEFVAKAPLSILPGSVNAQHEVVLDFPAGVFQSPVFALAHDPQRMELEFKTWLAKNDLRYVINRISSSVTKQVPQLTPGSFRLNTLTTNSGKNILQLFIATTSPEPSILTVNVNEPVPDGYGFSLIIAKPIVQALGAGVTQEASLFAVENLIFPGNQLLQLGPEHQPADLLALGHFNLAPIFIIVSGDKQSMPRTGLNPPGGIARFAPLQLALKNAFGARMPGVPVSFAAGQHPDRMAVQFDSTSGGSANVVTDANGVATSPGLSCYYEQGPFEVVASADGGQISFSLEVAPTPPPPVLQGARLSIVGGDGQGVFRSGTSIPGGTADFKPLQVLLTDGAGKPVPSYPVIFGVADHPGAMAVQIDPSGAAPVTVLTDSQGIATLAGMGGGSVECYYADGTFTITAAVAGGMQIAFTMHVVPAPPPTPITDVTLSIVSGNNQSAALAGLDYPGGIARFGPLQVLAAGPQKQPMPNIPVDFKGRLDTIAVQVDPSGASPVTVMTDAKGIATLNFLLAYPPAGRDDNAVIASIRGGNSQVSFTLNVLPMAPPPPPPADAHLRVISGNNQSVRRTGNEVAGGTAKFAPMQVRVSDALDRPIPNVQVQFTSAASSRAIAVQLVPAGSSTAVVLTDSSGTATLDKMPGGTSVWAYYGSGSFTITAKVGSAVAVLSGTVP